MESITPQPPICDYCPLRKFEDGTLSDDEQVGLREDAISLMHNEFHYPDELIDELEKRRSITRDLAIQAVTCLGYIHRASCETTKIGIQQPATENIVFTATQRTDI